MNKARELFSACGNETSFAPFYAAKAALFPSDKEVNLKKAIELDKTQWRYHKLLAEHYITKLEYEKSLAVVEPFYKAHPGHYIMGMLYAKALLLNKQYANSDAVLTKLDVIPFEGATDGRSLYHEAKLMQAVAEMKKGQYKKALVFIQASSIWPVNLGVGKPYPENIDERLENWLDYQCYTHLGDKSKSQRALNNILIFLPKTENMVRNFLSANTLVTAWALGKMDKKEEAVRLLDQWVQRNPENKTAVWARQVFENQQAVVPPEIKRDETVRILEQWIKDNG